MIRNKYFIFGLLMLVGGLGFLAYGLNHPEASFPWPNSITYLIYIGYLYLMVKLFKKSRK